MNAYSDGAVTKNSQGNPVHIMKNVIHQKIKRSFMGANYDDIV